MEIDGKAIAQKIIDELKQKPRIKRFLSAFLVGDDPASVSFLKQKEKTAKEIGIDFRLYKYPERTTTDTMRKEIGKIAAHKTCGGAIVQLPLPKHINAQYVLNAIPREKDIDVLGERALGAFYTGRNPVLPPAVSTAGHVLSTFTVQLSTAKVAVLGRGVLVGKPIAIWLMNKVAELAVFTSKTQDMTEKLKNYGLIITGVGKAGIIKPEYLKDGAGVIDFGYELKNGTLYGDLDITGLTINNKQQTTDGSQPANHRAATLPSPIIPYNLKPILLQPSFFTPTPGGTGPILVAKLFQNFFILNGYDKIIP